MPIRLFFGISLAFRISMSFGIISFGFSFFFGLSIFFVFAFFFDLYIICFRMLISSAPGYVLQHWTIIILVGLMCISFDRPNISNGHVPDNIIRRWFIQVKRQLLLLRAVSFIKSNIYSFYNFAKMRVVNSVSVRIRTIT